MAQCVTKIELLISCRGLKDKDFMSKSDPLAALLMQDGKSGKWFEYSRTERVKNDLNPDFSKAIIVDYYFEMVQKLKFVVYDVDDASKSLDDGDFLGAMECNLGQIVSKRTFTKELEMNGKDRGSMTVCAEEISGPNEAARLTFTATKLENKDFLGKSDPFLEISKMKSDGEFLVVHRTEVIENNLNPSWKTFDIPVQSLCSGDYDAKIKIAVFDFDEGDANDLIGFTDTTLRQLLDMHSSGKGLDLINPKKKQKKKYVNSGVLHVKRCEVVRVHSFLDYVMGGCQINFTVGVDFTASNGDPKSHQSLHYINPYEPNEYLKALTSVGEVCQDYDTDKFLSAFGFGAKVPPSFEVSDLFPLNFNPISPYCQGIGGVVAAYKACIQQVQMCEPTKVAPIINHVASFPKQGDASQYFVLLLLTDGELSDMYDTKLALVRASRLPVSVIIVGVGTADFTDMNELDADEGLLRAGKEFADRDIVQFVPFSDFKEQSPALLAQKVLAEVPKQVEDFFNKRNMTPLQPKGPASPSLAGH